MVGQHGGEAGGRGPAGEVGADRRGRGRRGRGPGRARAALRLALLASLLLGCRATPPGLPSGGRWIDLTHAFGAETLVWPTDERGFEHELVAAGRTAVGYWYAAGRYAGPEHGGTHLDAPFHFFEGRQTVDEVPVDRLCGPAVVVDVTTAADADRDYRVMLNDLLAWEKRYGPIPPGAIVLLRTGFSRHWPDPALYLGTAERGEDALPRLSFPGLHPEAARWLAVEREVGAVGIDTASIDHGPSRTFRSHVLLAEHQVPVLENATNLDRLPPKGAWAFALPLKIAGGSGAPVRLVAWVP